MPPNAIAHLDDEWWTTEMVCAFLTIGRDAHWERWRDQSHAARLTRRMAGQRNLYRARRGNDQATWIIERPLPLLKLRAASPKSAKRSDQFGSANSLEISGSIPQRLQRRLRR